MPKVKQSLIDRVCGMLMHLWSLVPDGEIRRAIQATIDELNSLEGTH